jgi:hypothetical protein
MKQYFLCIVLLLIGLQACSPRLDSKKQHISKKQYSKDSLAIVDYGLCISLIGYPNTMSLKGRQYDQSEFSIHFDHDSIFVHFLNALSMLDIPISKENQQNSFCDSGLYRNYNMDIRKIDFNQIKANNKNKGLTLVPILYLNSSHEKAMHFSLSGGASGGQYLKQTVLTIVIVILDGEEIIYLSSGKYFGKSYDSWNEKDPNANMTQMHWDKLVAMVMKDYLKRVK